MRNPAARELPCGVFGSFGWSGEAVDELENRLKAHLTFLILLGFFAQSILGTNYSLRSQDAKEMPGLPLLTACKPSCNMMPGQGDYTCKCLGTVSFAWLDSALQA